jgi:hypothetical protein
MVWNVNACAGWHPFDTLLYVTQDHCAKKFHVENTYDKHGKVMKTTKPFVATT